MTSIHLIQDRPARPGAEPHGFSQRPVTRYAITLFLQSSHRLGSVALFAMLGTWAMMYRVADFHMPLAISAACADIGLCAGLAARILIPPRHPARREANGVTIFNTVLFVLALYTMFFARLELIRSGAAQFFTPTLPTLDFQYTVSARKAIQRV
jgi:hypothetical protein